MAKDILTAGRTKLRRWASDRGRQAALAAALRVSRGTVCDWIAGAKRPSPRHRFELRAIAGIDPDEWLTAEERKWVIS